MSVSEAPTTTLLASRTMAVRAPALRDRRFAPVLVACCALATLLVVRAAAPNTIALLGIATMLGLAYANGANDISKAVATLVGSGVGDYRRAIRWGVLWTGVGAAASAFLSRTLVVTFSAGLLADGGARFGPTALLAVLLGALGWVLVATHTGLPVSTTHAITGALAAVAVVNVGIGGVAWEALARTIALPLAASPLLAAGLGLAAYALVRALPRSVPFSALHWLSGGSTGLARGLNDAPKIVALGAGFALAAGTATVPLWVFLAVAAAMAAGSWVGGRRVTRTLAERVTKLDHREGLGANLATALLVSSASHLGLPVSTTHVASAAIVGVGGRRGLFAVRWRIVGEMAMAWLVTLPAAALLAIAALFVLAA